MIKKILISGGGGFIGSHIARRCLQQGYEVTIIDDLSTGKIANIPEGARFIQMDIADEKAYGNIPSSFDVLLHLAAQSSGEISNEDPLKDFKVNTLGTALLLKLCRDTGISRFIYASSMAVYGNASKNPVSEEDRCEPLSFYGISKLSSEHYVQHYHREGLNTTCFRMFSVYGPGQNLDNLKQGMVSIFLAYLLKGEVIWVKGSKDRFRDFIYIDDVVDAWIQAIEDPATFGNIYNLGTGEKTCVSRLVEEEIRQFGFEPGHYPVKYEGSTPYDQFGLYADISKLKRDTGWSPRHNLERGLKKMVAWARSINVGQQ